MKETTLLHAVQCPVIAEVTPLSVLLYQSLSRSKNRRSDIIKKEHNLIYEDMA